MHTWLVVFGPGPCSQFLVWYGVWPEVLLPQVTGEYDPTQSEEAQHAQLAMVWVDHAASGGTGAHGALATSDLCEATTVVLICDTVYVKCMYI